METAIDQTRLSVPDTSTLLRTAKWARFIGIVGMVLAGLMVVTSFFIGGFLVWIMSLQTAAMGMEGMQGMEQAMFKGIGAMYTAIFVFMALLYAIPSWLLYRFAANTRIALSGPFDPLAFSTGLTAHRRMYKFLGILTAIVVVLYGFSFLMMAVAWASMPSIPEFGA